MAAHAGTHKNAPKGKKAAATTAKASKTAATPAKKGATAPKQAAKETVKPTSAKAAKAPAAEKEAGKGKKGKLCSETGCNQPQMSDQYCRLHYLKYWTTIIGSRKAQARANLNKYIETLSEKYPDEYMEKIRDDLSNEGAFHARLRELGFREEYESGGDNPFQMENFDEFLHGLKFED